MISTLSGIVSPEHLDLNQHMGTQHYLEIVAKGTHKYIDMTELKTLLPYSHQSIVISKLMCHFKKELLLGDEWNLKTALYKINSKGFSLVHNLNVANKRMAKIYTQCIYFNLKRRKSFTIESSDISLTVKDLISEISDPFVNTYE
jgi:acyl-CoA thioesterase FadM